MECWRVILARRSEPPAELAASLEITLSKPFFPAFFSATCEQILKEVVLGRAGKQPQKFSSPSRREKTSRLSAIAVSEWKKLPILSF